MTENLTPMMRQYHDIKRKLPGKLIFFRLGDFYEMFFDDAVVAARELEITLTSRNRDKKGEPIPMCGVPHHAVDTYIARLVKKGYKVAICDQLEDPRPGHLVKREVVRVVTPGTVTDEIMLDPKDNNFLAGVIQRGDGFGAAFLDVSTGDFLATQYLGDEPRARLVAELNHFQPAEVLYPAANAPLFADKVMDVLLEQTVRTALDDWAFSAEQAERLLLDCFQVATLDGFGLKDRALAVGAAGALLHYVRDTNLLSVGNLSGIRYFEPAEFLRLDTESVANLELVRATDGDRRHTLIHVLDFTTTNMGGRLLKSWVLRPLLDLVQIQRRQDAVEELLGDFPTRDQVRRTLGGVQDVERLMSRVNLGTARARDLLALKSSLACFPPFARVLTGLASGAFREAAARFDPAADITELLERSVHEDPPPNLNEGGVIKDGYSSELDELRALARGGKSHIADIEARERERTGINSLKVGYNRVFGYYIEVTKTNLGLVPAEFIRKQTLANAERFITPELKELEERVLSAEERMVTLERDLFQEVRRQVAAQSQRILRSARIIAETDTLASLAEAAGRRRYRRPVVDDSDRIAITQGRHPVIETIEPAFVPNDCLLDSGGHRLIILTGPNMGGKSTYLRQVALTVIMAQMGAFVPAESATVGLVDQVFTRVGASDNLARGHSTFMVEMIETANILHTCTPRSLVLLDEVGRGTATFDGLSLAWSVAEFLHNTSIHAAKTLFATHYHELTRLEELYPGIKNYCVTVKEGGGEIIFLRKVIPGAANRSYGIEVARLAGMPKEVVQRAGAILKKLERKEIDLTDRPRGRAAATEVAELQKKLF